MIAEMGEGHRVEYERRRRARRLLGGVAVAVLLAGAGWGTAHAASTHSPRAADLEAMAAAVNGEGTSLHVRLAPRSADATVSRGAAVATARKEYSKGSRVMGAGLVVARSAYLKTNRLLWMVSVDPAGGVPLLGNPSFFSGRRPPLKRAPGNFDLTFVDARTGRIVDHFAGRSPLLPPLPVIPAPKR